MCCSEQACVCVSVGVGGEAIPGLGEQPRGDGKEP